MRAEKSAECFVDCLDRESATENPMKSPKSHLSPLIFPDLLQFVWEIVWPFSKKSALNQALLDRSFGTVWYFANGHIPVGSRKFTPGPGPADVTTLKPSNPE